MSVKRNIHLYAKYMLYEALMFFLGIMFLYLGIEISEYYTFFLIIASVMILICCILLIIAHYFLIKCFIEKRKAIKYSKVNNRTNSL